VRLIIVKLLVLSSCAWFAAAAVSAQPAGQVTTASSYTGQFTAARIQSRKANGPSPQAVRVPVAGGGWVVSAPVTARAQTNDILLEPALLVVSCERMKQLLLQELGLKDEWRGRIDMMINSSQPKEKEPSLTAIGRLDGWSYELELPETIQQRVLVRAVMQALLLELANRQAGKQSAEVPYWLVEGLGGHVQAYNLPTFIVRPNEQSSANSKLTIEGPKAVQAGLRGRAPLTFQQLSWPEPEQVTGKDQALYDSCAELFYESLAHLDGGQACLRRMLQELPRHMNWQTAFLQAFQPHFAGLLDVEKWWGLICVNYSETDETQARTVEECWHKLQEALDVPVEVHLAPARMPAAARVTLQEVIEQWDETNALPAVLRAVRELEGLRWFSFRRDLNLDAPAASPAAPSNAQELQASPWRMSQELSALASRYLVVLVNYAKQCQSRPLLASDAKYGAPGLRWLKAETVRQLNDLDQKRAALRAKFLSAAHISELSAAAAGTNASPSSPPLHR
jgi:hypothetical protein